ncbi:unnamed protein product [Bemisia tabaci]|uniref:Uncharacterized protein n=1 Tax=Bemisia tabaci TaxID=7038 RepID=A0A9P0F4S6_BEMTA|nr:PREDICTED: uncharacterized protein LOC109043340 [Bemisia tabaci]CAH0388068.1 unnamed protein product [Bemisia tabaci]
MEAVKMFLLVSALTSCVALFVAGDSEDDKAREIGLAALTEAMSSNVCAKYNADAPATEEANMQALVKCKNAAEYLFMEQSIKRPEDCATIAGVMCENDEQKKMTCMIITETEKKPLCHCAQNFKAEPKAK